jgi:hypothetical protein
LLKASSLLCTSRRGKPPIPLWLVRNLQWWRASRSSCLVSAIYSSSQSSCCSLVFAWSSSKRHKRAARLLSILPTAVSRPVSLCWWQSAWPPTVQSCHSSPAYHYQVPLCAAALAFQNVVWCP